MRVISRIKGGIGNQLFCYAAARRLSLMNRVELIIDDVSGFVRDYQYRRHYMLDHFNITARKASPAERLEPFERYRRGILKWRARRKPFTEREYVEQEGWDFDPRLLTLNVNSPKYLDGYWQSEGYFKDIESVIRDDLRMPEPVDDNNRRAADAIRNSTAVAMHVRWFDLPGASESHNVSADYYRRAMSFTKERLSSPHYFLFSDRPDLARARLGLSEDEATCIAHNTRDEDAWADLWLMTQCKHFVTANSTFSWWGAWLSNSDEKLVVSPAFELRNGTITGWNYVGQVPDAWLKL
jgi:hypothetical protein